MTDPRYLVHERHLPFIPAGACCLGWRGDVRLDLSAPPERDGIPERLDALEWALVVLAKRVGMAIDDIDAIRPMMWRDSIVWDVYGFGGRYLTILSPGDDGWEDFDVDDLDQRRRIVAAALRKTHVQTESP